MNKYIEEWKKMWLFFHIMQLCVEWVRSYDILWVGKAMCVCVALYVHVCACTCACTCGCVCVCLYLYLYVYVYVYVCICVYVCVCVYVCKRTLEILAIGIGMEKGVVVEATLFRCCYFECPYWCVIYCAQVPWLTYPLLFLTAFMVTKTMTMVMIIAIIWLIYPMVFMWQSQTTSTSSFIVSYNQPVSHCS